MQTGAYFAFSDLFIQGLKDEGLNMTQLSDILAEKGNEITRRRLSEYYNQVSTPPFEKAREIVKALKIEITDEELIESLKINRDRIKELKQGMNYSGRESYTGGMESKINKVISLNLSNFCEGMTAELVEEKIRERLNLLYGETEKNEKYRMSRYVKDLIKKDLGLEEK